MNRLITHFSTLVPGTMLVAVTLITGAGVARAQSGTEPDVLIRVEEALVDAAQSVPAPPLPPSMASFQTQAPRPGPRPVPMPPEVVAPVPLPPMPPMPPMPTVDFALPFGNLYEQARQSIDAGRYDRALGQLNQLIGRYDGKPDAVKNRVDAAMYWKAYSQLKLDAYAEAIKTLQDMQKKFADSRWLRDAKALELEVRQASGQNVSPDMQSDDELKLLALRGLMQTSPDLAVPRIEQLLAGNSSVRVKENALFVLSQSRSPRAASIIGNTAKSNSNPDLQLRAVKYLGAMRADESMQVLDEIYRSSSDEAVKRAIIQSFSGSRAADRLMTIATTEKDLALRRTAVQTVGNLGRERSGDLLRSLYTNESNVDLKKEIISALTRQQNAPVLVQLARTERDQTLKKQMVSSLSNMKSKEATDYMLELLK